MSGACFAQAIIVRNDPQGRKVHFGNEKIRMTLDYDRKVNISLLTVNGQKVIEGAAGIYTSIRTAGTTYSTLHLKSDPVIKIHDHSILITGIIYGDATLTIQESWTFSI